MNKIILFLSISFFITNAMAQEKIVQTAGRTQLGEFAPKFAELNDDVLFGEVWSRTDKLGLRDRSLVTITSLISQGITDNSLVSIFSRQRRMELPVPRLQKSSPTSVFMPVGRKHGRHLIWPKTYGRKMRLAKTPKPLSNAR